MNVRVTPNRELLLDGKPVDAGKLVNVPANIAALWEANGWLNEDSEEANHGSPSTAKPGGSKKP